MDDIYQALVDIIGTPPAGLEWIIYLIACFLFITVFHFFTIFVQYIFKFIGGIR